MVNQSISKPYSIVFRWQWFIVLPTHRPVSAASAQARVSVFFLSFFNCSYKFELLSEYVFQRRFLVVAVVVLGRPCPGPYVTRGTFDYLQTPSLFQYNLYVQTALFVFTRRAGGKKKSITSIVAVFYARRAYITYSCTGCVRGEGRRAGYLPAENTCHLRRNTSCVFNCRVRFEMRVHGGRTGHGNRGKY